MGDDPVRGAHGIGEHRGIAGGGVKLGQRRDHPAVFARINVRVHPRNPAFAPRDIAELEIPAAVFSRHQVGVLTGVKRTLRAGEKIAHVALDRARALQVLRLVPERSRPRINTQVPGLHRHDFLEVRMVPVAVRRVLVNATPNRVDELALRGERLPGHARRRGVAGRGAGEAVFDVVPIEKFLVPAPTAELCVVAGEEVCLQLGAQGFRERAVFGVFDRDLRHDGRTRRRVVDDCLEHGCHLRRRQVAAALDDLAAVGGENHGRRPAVIFVAIGDVRARFLVHSDREITGADQRDDGWIAVGLVVHDVAPVAPDRVQIEQHEFVLAPRLLEDGI